MQNQDKPTLEQKVKSAKAYLGERYLCHPVNHVTRPVDVKHFANVVRRVHLERI